MKTLLNTAYLPPIAWFSCVANQSCTLDLAGNYQKQSFRNRARIVSSRGLLDLVVPVVHAGKQGVTEVEISYREHWVRQHVRSIETAYRNAPYFEFYWPEIQGIIQHNFQYLFQLNEALILSICKQTGLLNPSVTGEWIPARDDLSDMREHIHPKRKSGVQVGKYIRPFPIDPPDPSAISVLDLLFNKGPDTGIFLTDHTRLPILNFT